LGRRAIDPPALEQSIAPDEINVGGSTAPSKKTAHDRDKAAVWRGRSFRLGLEHLHFQDLLNTSATRSPRSQIQAAK
jgi:hypothetical protein